MARLNSQIDSDDDLPELFTVLQSRIQAISKQELDQKLSARKETKNLAVQHALPEKHVIAPETRTQLTSDKPRFREQQPQGLEQVYVSSLLLPTSYALEQSSTDEDNQNIEAFDTLSLRARSGRLSNHLAGHCRLAQALDDIADVTHRDDNNSYTNISGFIAPTSASDEEVLASRSQKKRNNKKRIERCRFLKNISPADSQEHEMQASDQPSTSVQKVSAMVFSKNKEECKMILEFPASKEPFRSELVEPHPELDNHLISSTSRRDSLLGSEDKYQLKKQRLIPSSPHQPSADVFWSQEFISDWNEQYSPKKMAESPRRARMHCVDENVKLTPFGSPPKSPSRSLAKKDKKTIEQRKLFDDNKHILATTFLVELDQTITNGQIASMAASAGGIKIIWSKKLSSTAGRANWRRETICSKNTDGSVLSTTHRHHASIELAEKVIDDEDRLVNVIAHEFCHLANFMISGIKDNPHGKDFKEWARKCTDAFSSRSVNVTTKHSYTITYKYVWTCVSSACGLEYKRHSKSIDPSRHLCGNCKGKLIQVQPMPRKGVGEGKRNEYQTFVKQENERVRLNNKGASFGEIMSILGREFREHKRSEAEKSNSMNEYGAMEEIDSIEPNSLVSVVRKLGTLSLRS